ncbi:MAG: type II toxin-antitoxin system RelE/ParE family toxin [Planctomycetota bacterium]|jgi:plasmid stabilization system protein ParE
MRFHPSATKDLVGAAEWYEQRAAGLGGQFLDAVEAALVILEEHPRLGAEWPGLGLSEVPTVRRFPLRLFPFFLVYVLGEEPTILSVAHASRRPEFWIRRLKQ